MDAMGHYGNGGEQYEQQYGGSGFGGGAEDVVEEAADADN